MVFRTRIHSHFLIPVGVSPSLSWNPVHDWQGWLLPGGPCSSLGEHGLGFAVQVNTLPTGLRVGLVITNTVTEEFFVPSHAALQPKMEG